MSRVRANSGIRGAARGGFAKPIKGAGDVVAPKPNLSFNDNRSVNALPFSRYVTNKDISTSDKGRREPPTAPKAFKPNNYNQGFALASPEDFLAQSWAGKSRNNAFSDDKKENLALNGLLDQARKPRTIANNTSGTEVRSIPASAAPSVTSTDVQQPSEKPTAGSLVSSSNNTAHSTLVQVGNEFGGKFVMIGTGIVRIKTVDHNPQIVKIIQIEVLGKTLLEEPLLESIELKLDICTISFYSGLDGCRTKWILTASQPGIAANVVEALERHKPQSTYLGSADASAKGYASEMATVEVVESLISFLDEDPTPPQAVSQFTEELFSLMGNQFIKDAVDAISVKIEQNSITAAASKVPGNSTAEDTQKRHKAFRGLATSRFANTLEVGDFFNRSAVFQKLPDSTAAYIKEQVSKRVFEETQTDTCDQGVFEPVKQQPRKQYSVEKLMSLGNQPSSAEKPSALDPSVESSSRDEPRPLFSFAELTRVASESPSLPTLETATPNNSRTTRLCVPIVSEREPPRKLPGLATSKYASPLSEVVFREPSKPKESELPASKPAQELSDLKKPDSRAPKPIQGLSTSKYASPNAGTLFRGPSNTKKPEPLTTKLMRELESSNDRPKVKAFRSFLNSQGHKPPHPKPFQGISASKFPDPPAAKMNHGLATSKFPDTPLTQSSEGLSTSNNSKPAPWEPFQELSTPDHLEPPVTKPFQGLASSKYASPLGAKHRATKPNMLTTAQSDPKNPAVVAQSSSPEATVADSKHKKLTQTRIASQDDAVRPSIFSMIMDSKESKEKGSKTVDAKILIGTGGTIELSSPLSGSWNTLRIRDSVNSHASKDSNETAKSLMPKSIVEPVQDYTMPLLSSRTGSGHPSILSMDSSASCEPFATAIDEASPTGEALSEFNQELADGKQRIYFQAGASDFVLFPDDATRPETAGTDLRIKSPYSSDMSELTRDSFASIPRPGPSDATSEPFFKPFNFPTAPARKPVTKIKGGLMSSRFATTAEDIAPGVVKPEPQSSSATISTKAKSGPTTQKLAPKPPISEAEPSTRPRVLKPTASRFTPAIGRSLTTPTPNLQPPAVSTFSSPMQPVMATILVQDPQWPGILREVSGLLKIGSTPIVGYIAAQNSPMGENFASGGTQANAFSPQRAPLSPIRQKSENFKGKQQEIQERLTKSLAQRRLSESPSPGGF